MASVRIVCLDDRLPPNWDLADPVPEGVDVSAMLASAVEQQRQEGLRRFITSAAEFVLRDIPPRDYIIEPFLTTSSLAMVYAARGVGKTWFSLSLGLCVAHGDDFISFNVEKPRTVLFIDGEMALADLQTRLRLLDPTPPKNFFLLPSESLFREDRQLNINEPEDQKRIEEAIVEMQSEGCGPDVVIFDNLSSLSGGVHENDNSALDALLRWLIGLRHKGLAMVLVHHAGKSGDQRGASRREDLLDTSIKLERPKPDKDDEDVQLSPREGAYFIAEFVKTRGMMPTPPQVDLLLAPDANGVLTWHMEQASKASKKDKTLKVIYVDQPSTQDELATLREVGKSAISHQCKSLRAAGYLAEGGLKLTDKGVEHLQQLWPEIESDRQRQRDLPI